MYDEYQCLDHSVDSLGGFDYYNYNNDDSDSFVNHTYFNPEVEFCAGHWNGEGPGFLSNRVYYNLKVNEFDTLKRPF